MLDRESAMVVIGILAMIGGTILLFEWMETRTEAYELIERVEDRS